MALACFVARPPLSRAPPCRAPPLGAPGPPLGDLFRGGDFRDGSAQAEPSEDGWVCGGGRTGRLGRRRQVSRRQSSCEMIVSGRRPRSKPPAKPTGSIHATAFGGKHRAPRRSDSAPDRRPHRRPCMASGRHRHRDRAQSTGCESPAQPAGEGRARPLALVADRSPEPQLLRRPGNAGTDHRVARRGGPSERSADRSTGLVATDADAPASSRRPGDRLRTRRSGRPGPRRLTADRSIRPSATIVPLQWNHLQNGCCGIEVRAQRGADGAAGIRLHGAYVARPNSGAPGVFSRP